MVCPSQPPVPCWAFRVFAPLIGEYLAALTGKIAAR
jgi:hypothetical protein